MKLVHTLTSTRKLVTVVMLGSIRMVRHASNVAAVSTLVIRQASALCVRLENMHREAGGCHAVIVTKAKLLIPREDLAFLVLQVSIMVMSVKTAVIAQQQNIVTLVPKSATTVRWVDSSTTMALLA